MKKLIVSFGLSLLVISGNAASVQQRPNSTQQVINTGTTVTTTTTNTVVNTECQTKFNGCVDAFCMTDNIDGGRCQCSAQYTKLATQLAELKRQDFQNYQLSTVGVRAIENDTLAQPAAKKTRTRRVDLSMWDSPQGTSRETNTETGDVIYKRAIETCMAKIPECNSNQKFLQTIYSQKIKSDCAAFENSIKQERTATQTRSAEAQRAMRTTAYKKLQDANKYDLGQCTAEYKKCMMTTAECGEDFKGCVNIVATENTQPQSRTPVTPKTYDITGSATTISIAYSTYDVLESKKPICDSVLNNCQNVRDQVWATFLREAAPQIKNAELLAESDIRTTCIGNISQCFQTACKDTIDPKDPDGSYDMCLTRPESMLSFCKPQLSTCGVDTSSAAKAKESQIWDFVVARLAAMRVDSCTTEVKQCLQSNDRCGPDYTACVGLDTDTIIRMCPYDKLVGCQKMYGDTEIKGDAVYDELSNMVQGIMLGIDNNMLEFCQNAATESMIRVCGDTEKCQTVAADKYIGAGSLSYGICYYKNDGKSVTIDYSQCHTSADTIQDIELGRVEGSTTGELGPVTPYTAILDGIIFWELVTVDDNGNLTAADKYFELAAATTLHDLTREHIRNELTSLKQSIDATVSAIESDPTVQYCMNGRKIRGKKDTSKFGTSVPRFPQLTHQIRNIIATSALKNAKANYYKKYDELYERQMKDYVEIAERQAEIKGENAKDVRREAARQSCVSLADMASLPMSPPPKGWGMWLVVGVVVAAAIVVSVVTFGAGTPLAAAAVTTTVSMAAPVATITGIGGAVVATTAATVTIPITATVATSIFAAGSALTAAGVAVTAAVGVAAATAIGGTIAQAASNHDKGHVNSMQLEMNGHHELNQWNFKQTIDTMFDWNTLKCTKCVESTQCLETSTPLFGTGKCKKWAEPVKEDCTEIQF